MYRAELAGQPRQRGQAYGETLRPQIQDHIERFWDGITQGSGQDPKVFIHLWLSEMDFLPAIDRWTPTLLEEVRGIGEGAALDFETILSWQFLDELGWYINYIFLPRLRGSSSSNDQQSMACSSFGVPARKGSPAILAQNWDSIIYLDGSQTLLHIRYPDNEYEIYAVTAVGRIGPFGVSSRGIGLCMNSLNAFVNFSARGLPVVFVSRGILEQPDYQSALAFVQNVPHATGQAYAVGGQAGISVYECSANQVRRYDSETNPDWVVHTNHPIVNTDLRIPLTDLEKQTPSFKAERKERINNSVTRFNCIQARAAQASPSIKVETVQAILGSHDSSNYPVCCHPRQDSMGATMFGMIMEFSSPPVFRVAPGRPCETEFETLLFQGNSGSPK